MNHRTLAIVIGVAVAAEAGAARLARVSPRPQMRQQAAVQARRAQLRPQAQVQARTRQAQVQARARARTQQDRVQAREALTASRRPIQHDARTEGRLRSLRSEMTYTILGQATPPFEIVPQPGVSMRTIRWANYHRNIIPQVEVRGVGAGSALDVTVLAPVSGHVGLDNARRWATSDTFTISYQHDNGPRTVIARDVKSTDLVSEVDVTVPLARSGVTRLFYDRSGSAGVAGYPSGRTIEIVRAD